MCTDMLLKVNKKVGKGLASAIETGEEVTQKTKEVSGVAKEKGKEVRRLLPSHFRALC